MNQHHFLFLGFIFFFQSLSGQDIQSTIASKPFTVNGSISTSLNYNETSSALHTYEQPLSYLISANLAPSVYGFSFPVSFSFSDMNKQFSHPFYRFGMSPSYKWAKLNLGHRSTNFSKFSVSGQKSFGAGIELTPGKFRFGFLYGKFKRDVGYRTTNPIDNLNQDDYSRKGFATKLGVGTDKNHVDLVFMRIADDLTTFDTSTNLLPESNVVVSAVTKFTFDKKIKIHADIAASVFTHNMQSDSLDLSAVPNFLQNSVSYLNINSSSNVAWAKDFGIDYKMKSVTLGLQYKRVDPEYRSLGAHYFRNDFQNIAITSTYRSKKVSISTNIGMIKDNLKNTKLAQTNRLLTRLNLSLNPTKKFSIAANYSNFSTRQAEGRVPLNDTIKMFQVNRNLTITPQFRFNNKKTSNSIMANIAYAEMLDKNDFAVYETPIISKTAYLQYMLQLNNKGLGITTNLNYTNFTALVSQTTTIGPTLSINKSMLKNKGQLQLSTSYLWSDNDQNLGTIINIRTGFKYRITKKQHIKFSFNTINSNYDQNATISGYNRSRGLLAYTYKF